MLRNGTALAIIVTVSIVLVVLLAFAGAPVLAQPNAQATNTPAPTTVSSSQDKTYVALLPSAAGTTRLIIVTLKADGKLELLNDPIGIDPATTQVGTWQAAGDTINLTITGDGKANLAKALTVALKKDGDNLVASDFDKTVFGDKPFTLFQRDSVEARLAALNQSYVSVDLAAGFPLDPFLVSVNGGGELDASLLGGTCNGFINGNPTLTVNWTGKTDLVRAFTFSDSDPTLVVQTPDGKFLCGDDSNQVVLDSQVEIANPAPGKYNIWVGSAAPKQLLPTILVLTTHAGVSVDNFQLSALVKRPAMPQTNAVPNTQPGTNLSGAVKSFKGQVAGPLGATPLTQDIKSEGKVAAFSLDVGQARCSGFVGETPDYVFDVKNTTDQITVWLASKQDTSLLVVGPDGTVYCNDDAGEGNTNPAVVVTKPAQGQYAVFVGRLNQDAPVQGTLTVTSDPKATPPASK